MKVEMEIPREPRFYPNEVAKELERCGYSVTAEEKGKNISGKEKMVQIYETMADITLENLKRIKEAEAIMGERDIRMVSATLQIYNFIADSHQPGLFAESPEPIVTAN